MRSSNQGVNVQSGRMSQTLILDLKFTLFYFNFDIFDISVSRAGFLLGENNAKTEILNIGTLLEKIQSRDVPGQIAGPLLDK